MGSFSSSRAFRIVASAGVLAALLAPAMAFAHGPVIQITVDGGAVVTRGMFPRANAIDGVERYDTLMSPQRVFAVPMAENAVATTPTDRGWYAQFSPDANASFLGPGFAYGHHGFAPSTTVRVNFAAALKRWNPATSQFEDPGAEQLQGLSGGNFATALKMVTSDDAASFQGLNFATPATVTDGGHKQFYWRLLGDGAAANAASGDGVYLQAFTVSTEQPGVAASAPYYLLLSKNASADEQAAAFDAAATLVPEPGTGIGLMFFISSAYLRRPRRRHIVERAFGR